MAAWKTLVLSMALVGVAVLIVAKLALSPFWPRYTPAECRRAYARVTTLADTQRVDLIPAFGSDSGKNHHCGEVRAAPQENIFLAPLPRHPDLSGTWVMNRARSVLQVAMPDSTVFVVAQDDSLVWLFRTHVAGRVRDTITIVLRPDSSVVPMRLRTMRLLTRAWWEGDTLVFWAANADSASGQTVRYSLGSDGQTFTAIENVQTSRQSHLNRWRFDRVR